MRNSLLYSEDVMKTFSEAKVLVCGLGGVGGTCFAALLRSGFNHLVIVDFDTVEESNLNRQILFNVDSLGKRKTDEAVNYAKKINPNIEISPYFMNISKDNINDLPWKDIDYIVDCIDDVEAKILLIEKSRELNIPLIISLGTGNRYNPLALKVVSLNQTHDDPLARKLRDELKKRGIPLTGLQVVFSEEKPKVSGKVVGSTMVVPSAAGLLLASEVMKYFERMSYVKD